MLTDDGRVFAIYVLWHPASAVAELLAKYLFTSLYSDPERPARRGLGIRVRFLTSTTPAQLPQSLPVAVTGRIAVVVLADAHLVVDVAWRRYVSAIVRRAPSDLVIPVALTAVHHLPSDLLALRTLDLTAMTDDERPMALLNRVMHDLSLRLDASSKTVRVFISHAKHDGLTIAHTVRRYFHEVAGLDDFFDAADVPFGSPIADEITNAAGTAVALLAVQTDAYSTRDWCRREVLEAKRRGVAIVVLAAVQLGEHRAFPYLGNVPVVRWNGESSLPAVVTVLLREVLRTRYFPRSIRALCDTYGLDPNHQVSAHPPELLTALNHCRVAAEAGRPVGYYLYPDPPLGTEEVDLLRQLDPDLKPVTPLTFLGVMMRGTA